MAVTGSPGAERARRLLNGVPDRFNEFCHMDQITFVHLADWILAHPKSCPAPAPAISVEECLFVFLDIVAQGNSFRKAAYNWDHDIKFTQAVFLSIVDALHIFLEEEEISPSCPTFKETRSRWRILKEKPFRTGKSRMDGKIKIGDEGGDGLEMSQERLTQAITALNNFIHEHREL